MNIALLLAALLAAFTWGLHTFVGGPQVVAPLLNAPLEPMVKWTHYYCWHMVTITLLAMTVAYGYAAMVASGWDVALFATLLSVGFMVWSLVLTIWKRRSVRELPQWVLFLAITACAVVGLLFC